MVGGVKHKTQNHLPFCSSVNEEVMGTDLQEAKLMRQEADIVRTCYLQLPGPGLAQVVDSSDSLCELPLQFMFS